ncbi:signal peptidase II [Candidatus Sumerlaeota bacterium]|nr:signal peptidase II [Candidatus Sumerlaeota bacterium]
MREMQTDLRQKLQKVLGFAAISLAIVLIDQATKAWVARSLWPPDSHRAVTVIPGLLEFRAAMNTGAAFSLFQRHPGLLAAIASLLALAVLVWRFAFPPPDTLGRLALGFIFGGAVGNLIDRFRLGYVVDFIRAHWRQYSWPTFNVADSCICVGIGLFFVSTWLASRVERNAAAPAGRPPRAP